AQPIARREDTIPQATQISAGEVESILEAHCGNHAFAGVLRASAGPVGLVSLLHRYVQFNSVFGAGVANLAGQIAIRRDIFRDTDEPVIALSDRSTEVAASIFYAAIDEFGDPTAPHRPTHRTLAQALLVGAAQFFGFGPAVLVEMLVAHAPTQAAMLEVH